MAETQNEIKIQITPTLTTHLVAVQKRSGETVPFDAKKIYDADILKMMDSMDNDEKVEKIITTRRQKKVTYITDEKLLADIAKNDLNPDVRRTAINQIDDEETLFDLYKVEDNVFNRWDIVEKINDENILTEIALNESEAIVYESAFGKRLYGTSIRACHLSCFRCFLRGFRFVYALSLLFGRALCRRPLLSGSAQKR